MPCVYISCEKVATSAFVSCPVACVSVTLKQGDRDCIRKSWCMVSAIYDGRAEARLKGVKLSKNRPHPVRLTAAHPPR